MNKIKINVKYQNNFIKYLVENNIEYDSLIKEKENYTLIINKEDYKKISRKFDTKKNKPEQTSTFLNFMAHELELLLGEYYE